MGDLLERLFQRAFGGRELVFCEERLYSIARAGVANLASAKRRRLWFASRVFFANPRNANPSKSSRKVIGVAMANLPPFAMLNQIAADS